jgi:hypothetical protein
VVIAIALAILAGEYVWARKLLDRIKETGTKISDKINPMKRGTPGS